MYISPMEYCPLGEFSDQDPDFRVAPMQPQIPMMNCPYAMQPQYGAFPIQQQYGNVPMQQQPITAGMPSGAPGGTTAAPPYPTPQALQGMEDAQFEMAPGSPVQQDVNYTQGFLRTQIGKRVLVSFLIGTNTYQDRTGILEAVGISYIILREETNQRLMCDIYSIKFVRIFV